MNVNIGEGLEIDVNKLVNTRLLLQANSGGGKSYSLRKVLEKTHGKVQQIVLDLEGEFHTLREKYDYILVGKEGEIATNIKTADLLARKLLEIGVSAIIDLYELKHHERILFVKRFLDSMINAPKELWHPCIIVIDEAHVFCPEKGKSEAMGSVIDMCTRGRKRGYCAVLATQRLSKLHKDAAAECNNKLIGRTGLDVDMKRASEELGFTTKMQTLELRDLKEGEFFAFGPAFSHKGIMKGKIGKVETTHPRPGLKNAGFTPPKPNSQILKILGKIDDLPKEAEQELKTIEDYRSQIRSLTAQLSANKRQQPVRDLEKEKQLQHLLMQEKTANASLHLYVKLLEGFLDKVEHDIAKTRKLKEEKVAKLPKDTQVLPVIKKEISVTPRKSVLPDIGQEINSDLGRCEKLILAFLQQNSDKSWSKAQIGAITGYSPSSGGFNNALSKLNALQYISRVGSKIQISEIGMRVSNDSPIMRLSPELWMAKLGACERALFSFLYGNAGREFSKEELGELTNYSPTSGGFNNALARLSSLELGVRIPGGMKLNPEIAELMGDFQ